MTDVPLGRNVPAFLHRVPEPLYFILHLGMRVVHLVWSTSRVRGMLPALRAETQTCRPQAIKQAGGGLWYNNLTLSCSLADEHWSKEEDPQQHNSPVLSFSNLQQCRNVRKKFLLAKWPVFSLQNRGPGGPDFLAGIRARFSREKFDFFPICKCANAVRPGPSIFNRPRI